MGMRVRELPDGRTELTFPMLIPGRVGEDGEPAPMDMAQLMAAQAGAQLMAAALVDAISDAVEQRVDEHIAQDAEGVQEGAEVGDGSGAGAGNSDRNPAQSPQPGGVAAAAAGPAAGPADGEAEEETAASAESASPDGERLAASPSFRDMLRFLVGLQAGPMQPPPWAGAEWRRILELSMADSGGMKRVASEEGLDEVKKWVYKAPEVVEGEPAAPAQVCAITQTPFEDGDEVAEMPCGHTFDSDSLMHWLHRESAACPVCRKEVASREVARTPEGRASSSESEEGQAGAGAGAGAAVFGAPMMGDAALMQPLLPAGRGVRMRVFNPAMMAGIRGPQRRLGDAALERTAEIEQQIEDDQIEEAILQAVMRDSMADV